MNYLKNIMLFLLVIPSLYLGQDHPSVHKIEYENYKNLKIEKQTQSYNHVNIIPLNKTVEKKLTKAVFGYLPDWEYLNNAHRNFDYSLLSHIAAFDFGVTANGSITNPAGWPWTNLINEAHQNGVKVVMCVINFDISNTEMHNLLVTESTRLNFIKNTKSIITAYNLDGINIDFEAGHINVSDRGDNINNFMKELTDSVHSWSPDLEVSFAGPAVNWGGWDFNGLVNACDYIFIMGYDFYGSWSSTAGPTAPLNSNSPYNIFNTINQEYASESLFYPDKLILGVPYFGPHWTTTTPNEGSATIAFQNSKRFRDAEVEAANYGLKWSNTFQNSWYSYLSGSTYHQVWYDNAQSMGLKYDLAIEENLKGIGMWALGYDGSRSELWDLIAEKFTIPVSVEGSKILPENYRLEQNYPNPFNPTTTIEYSIPNIFDGNNSITQNVSLSVFDIMGREIINLNEGNKTAGNYKVQFDASNLSSGVYYYTLKVFSGKRNFSQTKKMLVVK